jgi:DNA-binding response OmpR family regulator
MTKRAIYLTNGVGPDTAISRGLEEAGCSISCTHTVAEAIQLIKGTPGVHASDHIHTGHSACILVSSVKAGAIPLLTLLREQGVHLPPTLVIDEEGTDVHTIIRALQLGVREYVLGSDPEMQRQLSARLLAERLVELAAPEPSATVATVVPAAAIVPAMNYEWDPIGRVLHIGEDYLRLSSVEGRIFDALVNSRNRTVPISDLVRSVLMRSNLDVTIGARRLRPHVMRLRRKLDHYPMLGMRIVNMRGTGYMLI